MSPHAHLRSPCCVLAVRIVIKVATPTTTMMLRSRKKTTRSKRITTKILTSVHAKRSHRSASCGSVSPSFRS